MVSRKSRAKAKLSTRMTGCSYSGCRAPRSARAARTSGGPAMHQVLVPTFLPLRAFAFLSLLLPVTRGLAAGLLMRFGSWSCACRSTAGIYGPSTGGDGPVLVLLHPGWGDSSICCLSWTGCRRITASSGTTSRVRPIACPGGAVLPAWRSGRGAGSPGCGSGDADGHSGCCRRSRCRSPTGSGLRLLLLAPGVQDYPWPPDDPYGQQFDTLFAAGDRDALAALGLRTSAAAVPTRRRRLRSAGQPMPTSCSAATSGPTRPSTAGSARSGFRPRWWLVIRSTRWWRAAPRTSPPRSPAGADRRAGCRPPAASAGAGHDAELVSSLPASTGTPSALAMNVSPGRSCGFRFLAAPALLAFAAYAGSFAALGGQHVGVAGVGVAPAQVVLQPAG